MKDIFLGMWHSQPSARLLRASLAVVLFLAMGVFSICRGQNTESSQPPPAPAAPISEEVQKNPTAPCLQPPPLVRWQDYQGPMAKVVGAFGRKVERKSVHPPHYKPGDVLCTFKFTDKLRLFAEDLVDPFTILNIGFNAGLDQAENTDPTFGQGAAGYGKRFAASTADQASGNFFKFVLFPTIFSQDPRYYRLGHGAGGARFVHALEHAVVTHQNDGRTMFNYTELLGTTSGVILSNTYHPGNKRGAGPVAEGVALNIANDVAFDVLREFWPEIAHKMRLPFRDEHEPAN